MRSSEQIEEYVRKKWNENLNKFDNTQSVLTLHNKIIIEKIALYQDLLRFLNYEIN